MENQFQSTRPERGATCLISGGKITNRVSIHAPRAGRDDDFMEIPCAMFVSIHAPRAGRDRQCYCNNRNLRRFNPRAPSGARLPQFNGITAGEPFQSTRPERGATQGRL